ncbi:MAG: hypothetical protein JNJ41_02470 [Bacteroidia bacterium]|nr:hypothetical protein [Bacteroidia bacterium]
MPILDRDAFLKKQKEEEALKQKEACKPRWFILSYDAGKELYDLVFESGSKKRIPLIRERGTDDFRKNIIRILRTKKVEEMREPVETTIIFRDPTNDKTLGEKLDYWDKEFKLLGTDFNFIIAAVLHSEEKPCIKEVPKLELQKNFHKLFLEVIEEEKKKTGK